MLAFKTTINPTLSLLRTNIRKAIAHKVSTAVYAEFVTMLNEAPQYSGNYVAHMKISTAGKRGGKVGMFDIPKNVTEAYQRGNSPAINVAISNSGNFVGTYAGNLLGKGGWLPTITIFNYLDYAGYVEERDKLRAENAGGEHAVEKMMARIENIHEIVTMQDFR